MIATNAPVIHTFRWFLPTSIKSREKAFLFDLTNFCQKFFERKEYYSRRTTFDRKADYDHAVTATIQSVKVKLYPFTVAPMSNTQEAERIIADEIGSIGGFAHIVARGNLRHAYGLAIIELTVNSDFVYPLNLTPDLEYDIEKRLNWDMDFEVWKLQLTSLASDIGAFFMLGLHLTFLTYNTWHESHQPQSSGLVTLNGGGSYMIDEHSDMLAYPLLLESDQFEALKSIWERMAQVWHKDLWSIHRFIKAVRSDYSTIDHFVDLVVTLESFFPDNTPQPMMRLICGVIVGTNEAEAKKIDKLHSDCFRIRNEVVHGGKYYRLHDKNKEGADAKMILNLFWELKNLNIHLIHRGIDKLIRDRNAVPANAIRFSADDILKKTFI